MTHTWKFLCLAALGAALIAGPRLRAAGTDDPKPQPTNADIKSLLEKLNEKLGNLESDLKDMKSQRGRADARTQGIEEQLHMLGDRLDQMERRIDHLPAATRQSFFQPTPGTAAPVPTIGAGTIVLQNTWGDMATVTINDRSIVVPPYQTVTLQNQATGTYTYDVTVNGYGRIRGPVSRFLDNNDRILISVFPVPAIR